MNRHLGLAIALCTVLHAPFAHAQSAQSEQEADRLFKEANELVARGAYQEACPKLERSQEIGPGVGTQFNLAHCYEMTGRRARALALFREVERTARAAGKQERADMARQRAAALENKVPQLRWVLAAPVPGLEVKVDGEVVSRSKEGAEGWSAYVDPGKHEVSVFAPGKRSWSSTVNVTTDQRVLQVTVPALEDEPAPAPPPAAVKKETLEAPPAAASQWSTQRTLAVVAAGVGIVGLGVGTYFAFASKSDHDEAQGLCGNRDACPTPEGANKWNDATSKGTLSTIAFAIGGSALLGGGILWFTAPKASPAKASGLRLLPSLGANQAGLTLTGGFH